jgi:stage II sporulation protein D
VIAALLAVAVAAGGATGGASGVRPGLPATVTVRVLSRAHPASVEVSRPGESHFASASGGRLWLDGAEVEEGRWLPEGRWRLRVAGLAPREYSGAVRLAADGGEVAVVVRLSLEEHVAATVASESEPGTPHEALKALAVVARSFAAAARGRHPDADLCDLAHCQVMGAPSPVDHREAALSATRATAGRVLRLPDGGLAAAPFHAACGGHTADPRQAFGGEGAGSAAVPDPGCAPRPWQASLDASLLSRVAGEVLHRGAPVPVRLADLRLVRGEGGWVVQVTDGTAVAGGDLLARSLDRALGYGKVRSSRFDVSPPVAGRVQLLGGGIGLGVGLCQEGASRRAAAGASYAALLRLYFPRARLDPEEPVSPASAGPTAPRSAPLSRTSSP